MTKPETHRHIVINRLLRTLRFVTQALVPLAGMGSMHMRWSGARSRIPLHVPACLSIQTIRRSLAAAASATTNCCSRKVTDHPCTKKVGRTRFAPLSLQSVGTNRSAPSAIASPFDGNWSVCSPDHPTPLRKHSVRPRNKPRFNFSNQMPAQLVVNLSPPNMLHVMARISISRFAGNSLARIGRSWWGD